MEEVKDKGPCSGVNSLHRPTLSLCALHSALFHSALCTLHSFTRCTIHCALFHSAFTALHSIIAQCTVLHCIIAQCTVLLHNALYFTALYYRLTISPCAALNHTTLTHSSTLSCTPLHTTLHCTACRLHFVSFSFRQSQSKGIVCFPES